MPTVTGPTSRMLLFFPVCLLFQRLITEVLLWLQGELCDNADVSGLRSGSMTYSAFTLGWSWALPTSLRTTSRAKASATTPWYGLGRRSFGVKYNSSAALELTKSLWLAAVRILAKLSIPSSWRIIFVRVCHLLPSLLLLRYL